MSSPKVIFNYNCIETVIECQNNEEFEEIIKRFKIERGFKLIIYFMSKMRKKFLKSRLLKI